MTAPGQPDHDAHRREEAAATVATDRVRRRTKVGDDDRDQAHATGRRTRRSPLRRISTRAARPAEQKVSMA